MIDVRLGIAHMRLPRRLSKTKSLSSRIGPTGDTVIDRQVVLCHPMPILPRRVGESSGRGIPRQYRQ